MPTLVVAPIDLLADAPDADRHAFARNAGFPSRSVCGQVRWTVRLRSDQGGRFCPDCVVAMREELSWLTSALPSVDAGDQAGNHFAGMPA